LSLQEHPSFIRPPKETDLWRYTDLSKFVDLLTSQKLWLANAEILAASDPYEGQPSIIKFPHRLWKKLEDLPDDIRDMILARERSTVGSTDENKFKGWFQLQEQKCMFSQYGRRDLYVNCWHAANHESYAMWKIYGSPGVGLAVVTNSERLEKALSSNEEDVYFGSVGYRSSDILDLGMDNAFDSILVKRENFSYENEARLVYWDTSDIHDPLANFNWNDELMCFEDIVEDNRPLIAGKSFKVGECPIFCV